MADQNYEQTNTTDGDEQDRAQDIAELIQSPGSSLVPMIEKAQIDTFIVTARAYPRVISKVMEAISALARLDEQAAKECVYALPRGGKPIIGASIRFAEIAKQCWGNCSAMAYVTTYDREGGWIEAEGRFIDFQTLAETKQRVRRRIVDKRGRVFSDDMIIVTGNAACAIAMRNVILAGIPRPAWRQGYENALAIAIEHKGETFAEARDKAIKAFGQFGVSGDQILGALGLRAIDDLQGEHIAVMRGMFSALKNGEETVESMFNPRQGRPFQAVKNPLRDDDDEVGADGGSAPQTSTFTSTAGSVSGSGSRGSTAAQGSLPAADKQQAATEQPADPKAPQEAPAAEQPATSEPDDEETYEAHFNAWHAETGSAAALADRWKQERKMRERCGVTSEVLNRLKAANEARIAKIKAGAL